MSSSPSVWGLIKNAQFEEACILADEEAARSKSLLPLRNKVIALFHLKKFAEALDTCLSVIEQNNGDTDSDFIFAGSAQWILGDNGDAVQTWEKGLKAKYTDAAGGVEVPALLFFAGCRIADNTLRDKAVKMMQKITKSNRSHNWPGPIGAFLCEKINSEELVAKASVPEVQAGKQLCQAFFYLGVKNLGDQDRGTSREAFFRAAKQPINASLNAEFFLAVNECAI